MEPQYSVLIFSKYSPNCKRVFDMINASGIDLDRVIGSKLQPLCIDNAQVRQRIKNNNQIDVTSVPCILSVFPNGGVEKYDGGHAFSWIENLLLKYAPPPPPPPPQQPRKQVYQQPIQEPEPEEPEPEPEQEPEPEPEPRPRPRPKQKKQPVKVPSRMKPIQPEEPEDRGTSIEDIPLDDTDRHRNMPQPRRIRQDEDKFLEDDELFSGEIPDIRREQSNSVRSTAAERKTASDPNGIRAKAEALARGRDDIDRQFASPNQRPIEDRRP